MFPPDPINYTRPDTIIDSEGTFLIGTEVETLALEEIAVGREV